MPILPSNIPHDGFTRFKSLSGKSMNSVLPEFPAGWKNFILLSGPKQMRKMPRFTGVMKQGLQPEPMWSEDMRLNARKERVSMISAVSNHGKLWFMLYESAMNGKRLIEFVKRLVKSVDRKVILTLDNPKVHHANQSRMA